ncbi:MAG: hypothetical protein RIC80_20260 [Cyclobacteriaceae bacterium]
MAIVSSLQFVLGRQVSDKSRSTVISDKAESHDAGNSEYQLLDKPGVVCFSSNWGFCGHEIHTLPISNTIVDFRHLPGVGSVHALIKEDLQIDVMNRFLLWSVEELALDARAVEKVREKQKGLIIGLFENPKRIQHEVQSKEND